MPIFCTKISDPLNGYHFLKPRDKDKEANNYIPHHVREILWTSYAYPIAISYIIRNVFAHDGGLVCQEKENDFTVEDIFEGKGIAEGYRISDNGWKYLEKKLKQYKVESDQTRVTIPWKDSGNDMLQILKPCHDELDDALGCLVGWTIDAVKSQTKFLLERDLSSPMSGT